MKLKRNWPFRLDDIIEYSERIFKYTIDISYQNFIDDELRFNAILHWLTIIGEATNHIPLKIQQRFSDIPWHKIVSLRNLVVHEYVIIEAPVIWKTATVALPLYYEQIKDIKTQLPHLKL